MPCSTVSLFFVRDLFSVCQFPFRGLVVQTLGFKGSVLQVGHPYDGWVLGFKLFLGWCGVSDLQKRPTCLDSFGTAWGLGFWVGGFQRLHLEAVHGQL